MRRSLQAILAGILALLLISGSFCLPTNAETPKEELTFKLFSLGGKLATEVEKGNPEADFLLSFTQYYSAKDKTILNTLKPVNATQAFWLSCAYSSLNDYEQANHWLEESLKLLNPQLAQTSPHSSRTKNDEYRIMSFIGKIEDEAAQGNQEAEFLLNFGKFSLSKNAQILELEPPQTVTQAYFLAMMEIYVENLQKANSYLDLARSMLTSLPSQGEDDQTGPLYTSSKESSQSETEPEEVQPPSEEEPLPEEEQNDTESSFIFPESELQKIEDSANVPSPAMDAVYLLKAMRYYFGNGVSKNTELAASYALKSAERGNKWGQAFIGYLYHKGHGVQQDYKKAAYWYQLSLDNGDTFAYNNLGIFYKNGWGVPKNTQKAEALYRLDIKSHLGKEAKEAYFNLGLLCMDQKKYAEAEKLILQAAAYGIKESTEALAILYDKQKKFSLSFPLWHQAALKGDKTAIYNVAVSYAQGEGVTTNYAKAYYYAGIAAKKGIAKATLLKNQLRTRLTQSQVNKLDLLIKRDLQVKTSSI